MKIIIDSDAAEAGAEILSGLAGIAARDAARPELERLQAAYFAAEDAANTLDATDEQIAAYRAAETAYHDAMRAVGYHVPW